MRILKLKLHMTSHGFKIHFEKFISVSASPYPSHPPFSPLKPKGQWLNDVFCGRNRAGGVQRICCVSLPDRALPMTSLWCRDGLSCCVPIYLLSSIGHLFVQFPTKHKTGLIATTTTSFPTLPFLTSNHDNALLQGSVRIQCQFLYKTTKCITWHKLINLQ